MTREEAVALALEWFNVAARRDEDFHSEIARNLLDLDARCKAMERVVAAARHWSTEDDNAWIAGRVRSSALGNAESTLKSALADLRDLDALPADVDAKEGK